MSPAGCGTLAAFQKTHSVRSSVARLAHVRMFTRREAFFNLPLELLELDLHDFIFDCLDGCLHFDKVPDPFSD